MTIRETEPAAACPDFHVAPRGLDGVPGVAIIVYAWSKAVERAIRDTEASTVVFDPRWRNSGSDFDRLAEFGGQILSVGIQTSDVEDLSPIARLTHLERFQAHCAIETLDFGKLVKLRECLLAGVTALGNLAAAPSLEDVALVKGTIRNLESLRAATGIRRLLLNDLPRLSTLDGLPCHALENLRLHYLPRLKSVADVCDAGNLAALEIVGCSGIADAEIIGGVEWLRMLRLHGPSIDSFDFIARIAELRDLSFSTGAVRADPILIAPIATLRKLTRLGLADLKRVADIGRIADIRSLEWLSIVRGPTLQSLAFLKTLTSLRELSISKTRVQDGDFHVLMELPALERVHALQPHLKHYSQTKDEVNAVLDSRRSTIQSMGA